MEKTITEGRRLVLESGSLTELRLQRRIQAYNYLRQNATYKGSQGMKPKRLKHEQAPKT
jgi:hypothetical protein